MFNIYMSDVPFLGLHGKVFQYADDTAILLEHSDIEKAGIWARNGNTLAI